MSKPSKKIKGTTGQWITNAIISFLIRSLKRLPFKRRVRIIGRLMQGPLGRLLGYRGRIIKNLSHVYPDMTDAQKNEFADKCLDNAGRTIIENYSVDEFLDISLNETPVMGPGLDPVLKAVKEGRPIQFVSGHFGNYEAFRGALLKRGVPVGGLYRPMSNPYFNEHYVKTIQHYSKDLFPTSKKGVIQYRRCLKNGGWLGIMIDLAVVHANQMEFLGKPAMTSTAAAAFAMESDALYLTVYGIRQPDGHSFEVHLGAPIEHTDPETMTRQATQELEAVINDYPEQWFWVHRRWKPFI